MNDPYKILGVPRGASQEAVKQAYRRLAMELHPDRNPATPGIADRFKDVTAAYGILGDARKRALFDRGEIDALGRRRPKQPQPEPGPRAGEAGSARASATASHTARAAPRDGRERRAETRSKPAARRREAKPRRAANGAKAADGARRWFAGGINADDLFGSFLHPVARVPDRAADDATPLRLRVTFMEAARGATKRLVPGPGRTLEVAVPAGIRDGQVIRLKGQGVPGPMGGARDALVRIEVGAHPLFRTEGDDIHLEVPVSLQEAVLGAKIRVPTIDGSVEVTVPPATNSGAMLRLRGKGLARGGGKTRGDQMIRLVIKLPGGGDPDLENFVRRWQARRRFDPREHMRAV